MSECDSSCLAEAFQAELARRLQMESATYTIFMLLVMKWSSVVANCTVQVDVVQSTDNS